MKKFWRKTQFITNFFLKQIKEVQWGRGSIYISSSIIIWFFLKFYVWLILGLGKLFDGILKYFHQGFAWFDWRWEFVEVVGVDWRNERWIFFDGITLRNWNKYDLFHGIDCEWKICLSCFYKKIDVWGVERWELL